VELFLNQLERLAGGDWASIENLSASLDGWRVATDEEVSQFAELLHTVAGCRDLDRITPLLARALENLAICQSGSARSELPKAALSSLLAAYRKLPGDNELRAHILRVLAADGGTAALAEFARLLVEDPPTKSQHATLALVSLAHHPRLDVRAVYPGLLDAVAQRSVAAALLDVTNYLVRTGRLDAHPAKDRVARLATLAQAVTAELEKLEARQFDTATSETVAESVELAVALCETLAQVGDRSVLGKLTPMLELKHRRLQAEAASALARLGEKRGLDHLAALAEHAAIRSRALAYLEELAEIERADEQFRSPQARAEGDAAAWLADPYRYGFPPQTLELVDSRRQFWPGYDDPVDCFLFRYLYPLPHGDLAGIALAGPDVDSFEADSAQLEPEDLYGLFASRAIEHDDCFETPTEHFDEWHIELEKQVASRLASLGYTHIVPVLLGNFFDKQLMAFEAAKNGIAGTAIVDLDPQIDEADGVDWIAAGSTPRPMTAQEAYGIHIGRLLLRSFNA
jgi:hypothetical protein